MTFPPTSSAWDTILSDLLFFVATTSEAGAPPPCETAALFALNGYARTMGKQIPDGYVRLLAEVNGISLPPLLKLCGVGIPFMDEHQRLDFLLLNQAMAVAVSTEQRKRTIFGLLGDNQELICWEDTHQFAVWNRDTRLSEIFSDFDTMLAAVLSNARSSIELPAIA